MSKEFDKTEENYVLFYSVRCQECEKFNKLLQEYPSLNEKFKKVPIDGIQMNQIPPQLTHVPGVICGNQLIMGPNAFQWLGDKTKNAFCSGPAISAKSGISNNNFSFIGESEDNYSSNFANFGKESLNNGSSIDPKNFDPRDGSPVSNRQKEANELPSNLQSQQVGKSDKLQEQDFSRFQQQREQEIASM